MHAQQDAGWTVASWLVANAQEYGISEVRYAGYEWNAADGNMGWQRASRGAPIRRAAVLSRAEAAPAGEPPYCDSSRTSDKKEFTRDLHHRAALR